PHILSFLPRPRPPFHLHSFPTRRSSDLALGFALRLRGLNRVGLNEDEVHKVEAARAYFRGNFSVNLEHPMLMKSLIAVSLAAAEDRKSTRLNSSHQIISYAVFCLKKKSK